MYNIILTSGQVFRALVIKVWHDPEHNIAVLSLSIAFTQLKSAFSAVKAAVHSGPESHIVSIAARTTLTPESDLYK